MKIVNNEDRAEVAHRCIMYFEQQSGDDRDNSLRDLLANLMHWADEQGEDFDDALRVARMNYAAEVHEEVQLHNHFSIKT